MSERTGLLLVHAFPADATMWQAQVAALAAPDLTVVAPSHPGFGGTTVPAQQPSLDEYADSLVRHLDDAGIGRAVSCGLSMGGYVALAFWRRHPDRIAGILLADTKAEADTEQAQASRQALAAKVRELGPEQAFFAAAPRPGCARTRPTGVT